MDVNSEIRILKMLIESNFRDRRDIAIRNYIKKIIKELKKIIK